MSVLIVDKTVEFQKEISPFFNVSDYMFAYVLILLQSNRV